METKAPMEQPRESQQTDDVATEAELLQAFLKNAVFPKVLEQIERGKTDVLDIQSGIFARAMSYANHQSPGCSGRVTLDDGMAMIMGTVRALSESVTQSFDVSISGGILDMKPELRGALGENGQFYAAVKTRAEIPLGLSSKNRALYRSVPDASTNVATASAIESIANAAKSVAEGAIASRNAPKVKSSPTHREKKTKAGTRVAVPKGGTKRSSPNKEGSAKSVAVEMSEEGKLRRKFLQSCLRSSQSKDWAAVLDFYKKSEADIRSAVSKAPIDIIKGVDKHIPPLERLGLVDLLAPLPKGASWADSEEINELVQTLVKRADARFRASRVTMLPVSKDVFISTYKDLKLAAPKSFREAITSTRAHIKRSLGMRDEPLLGLKYIKQSGDRSIYRATWCSEGKGSRKVYTFLGFLRSSIRSGPTEDVVNVESIPDSSFIPYSALEQSQSVGGDTAPDLG